MSFIVDYIIFDSSMAGALYRHLNCSNMIFRFSVKARGERLSRMCSDTFFFFFFFFFVMYSVIYVLLICAFVVYFLKN